MYFYFIHLLNFFFSPLFIGKFLSGNILKREITSGDEHVKLSRRKYRKVFDELRTGIHEADECTINNVLLFVVSVKVKASGCVIDVIQNTLFVARWSIPV